MSVGAVRNVWRAGGWRRSVTLWAGLIACDAALAAEPVSFRSHVQPILAEHCAGCHNPDKARGGLDLTSHRTTLAGGSGGAAVVPGDPEASILYGVVSHAREPKMPRGGDKLSDPMIAILRDWIAGGCIDEPGGRPAAAKPAATAVAAPNPAVLSAGPDTPAVMPRGMRLAPAHLAGRANTVVSMAAHPRVPVVAVAGQHQVLIYHTRTCRLLGVLPFEGGSPQVLRFAGGGHVLVGGGGVGGKSGQAHVWSAVDGSLLRTIGRETDALRAADIDPTLRLLAVGGPSRAVSVHSMGDGSAVHRHVKHTDWVQDLAYSPDGVLLATADRNGGCFVWEAESHALLHALPTHPSAITSLDWRGDGNVLATACEDGQVRLFEVNGGSQVRAWKAHEGGALCVRWSADGRLVTAGRDRLVRLWNQDGAALRRITEMPDIAVACALDCTGTRVIAADYSGAVRVCSAEDGATIGELSANPPSIADQRAAADQRLAAAREARATAEKACGEARAASEAASAALAQSQAALQSAEQGVQAANAALAGAAEEDRAARLREAQLADQVKSAEGAVASLRSELDGGIAAVRALADEEARRHGELASRETAWKVAAARAEEARRAAANEPQRAELVEAAGKADSDAAAARAAFEQAKQAAAETAGRIKSAGEALDGLKARHAEALTADASARTALSEARAALGGLSVRLDAARRQQEDASKARDQTKAQLDAQSKAASEAAARLAQAVQSRDTRSEQVLVEEAEVLKWEAAAIRVELDQARMVLAERIRAWQPLADAASASQVAAEQTTAAVADARRRLDAGPALEQELASKVDVARQAASAARAEEQRRATVVAERTTLLAAYAAMVEQLKSAAPGAAEGSPMHQALSKATEVQALLQQELDAAQNAAAQGQSATAAAEQGVAAAQAALTRAQQDHAALPAKIAEQEAAAEAAARRADSDRRASIEARGPVDEAEQPVLRLTQRYQALLEECARAYAP